MKQIIHLLFYRIILFLCKNSFGNILKGLNFLAGLVINDFATFRDMKKESQDSSFLSFIYGEEE